MAIRVLSLFSWLTFTRSRLEWCLRLGETHFALLKSWIWQLQFTADSLNLILRPSFPNPLRKGAPVWRVRTVGFEGSSKASESIIHTVHICTGVERANVDGHFKDLG